MMEELGSSYDSPLASIRQQKYTIPGQLGFLSTEQILFGNLCGMTTNYRILTLTNKSDSATISFQWKMKGEKPLQNVQSFLFSFYTSVSTFC